jgi:OFA family oxalate/formate antiporter-like MFS transporter
LFLAAYLLLTGALISIVLRNVSLKTDSPHSSRQNKPLPSRLEFTILWLCFFLNSMIGVMLFAHAAPMVGSFSGSERNAILAIVVVSLGNGIGRLFGGWFADSFPGRTLLVGAPAIAFLTFAMLVVTPSAGTALFSLAVVGIAYGSIASGMPAIIASYYGGNRMARIYGRVFTAWGSAGVLGPIVAGAVFDWHGDYKQAIVGAMIIALAAAIAGALYRPRLS